MTVRGVRGAIQIEANTVEAISQGTHRILTEILAANPDLTTADLASAYFSLTDDLTASYPAEAARDLPGWTFVPLLCAREIRVPSGMERCLRVLLHWNTDLPQDAIQHVYLGEAARLRPDMNRQNGRTLSAKNAKEQRA